MLKTNKFIYILAALFAVIVFIISSLWGGGAAVVHAATSTTTEFEKQSVMDDLKTATINGKPFDTLNYPYDSTGVIKHPEIMTVVEYCYSIRAAQRENYGVYIYFYNPQALNISTLSRANKITLGVKYGTDKDGNIKVDDYEKFDLQFCSKSDGDYRDLFYKFKIIDHKSTVDGKTISERVNSNARRYDISEIELLTVSNKNATAYGVGGTYTFTGYAKGYGADQTAESTLACERKDLETVTLDLAGITDGVDKRTYWRSNSASSLGKGHQNQINSVFFAIDNSVLEKYGYSLQRIKAEWWEYKTRPTVITSDKGLFDKLSPLVGQYIGKGKINDDVILYMGAHKVSTPAGHRYNYDWAFNMVPDSEFTHISEWLEELDLLFYTGGIEITDYNLSASTLQKYCEEYNTSYNDGHITFNEHDFSADLFTDSVDSGRTRGYNLREFDITNPDDYYNLKSYDSTHNWFQKFLDYGFGTINTSDEYLNVAPIEMITDEHIASNDISNVLKIHSEDINRFKNFYNDSVKADKSVFIFHYAFIDYYSAVIDSHRDSTALRQGTQFFDFDILTMTFNKDGDLTTLGCVSSPVDHWTGYTPAIRPTEPDWLKWVKLALGLIITLIVLYFLYPFIAPFFGFIAKGFVWVITTPFKAIGALFRRKKE